MCLNPLTTVNDLFTTIVQEAFDSTNIIEYSLSLDHDDVISNINTKLIVQGCQLATEHSQLRNFPTLPHMALLLAG
jgi:hypothetical protein